MFPSFKTAMFGGKCNDSTLRKRFAKKCIYICGYFKNYKTTHGSVQKKEE
eukprot:m.31073 g.31073  ORF g.31073 m.31073 type:complete len:50 (+) comp31434_c0_seq4:334-483(+)